jgi:hypothetical protein
MPVLKWSPHNLVTNSEDFTSGYTHPNVSLTSGVTDPTGGTGAFTVTSNSSSGYIRPSNTLTVKAGVSYTLKAFHKNLSGTASIGAYDASNTTFIGTQSITNTSSDWALTEFTFTTPAGCTAIYVYAVNGMSNGATVDAFGLHLYHLYRSDLGGMVDNPDRGDSYVPTTSSAVYLPRIGHHVYNGSAWVNEGLLAESEARTNKEKYSDFASSIIANNLTVSTDQAVSPDGTENATELTETGANDYHRVYQGANKTGTANSDHTFSAYVKRGSGTRDIQLRGFYLGTGAPYVNFDLGDGTVGSSSGASGTSVSGHTWTLSNTNIQDVGNGWYRVSATVNASSDFTVGFVLIDDASTAIELEVYQGDNTSSVLVYGAQFEAASTPSSLIPTSGSGVTRPAETFTIPSANLPWPEPVYIGDNLVTNGTFNTDTTGWTAANSSLSVVSQALRVAYVGASPRATATITTEIGKTYTISFDAVGSTSNIGYLVRVGIFSGSDANYSSGNILAANTGTYTAQFVATATTTYITAYSVGAASGQYSDFDNISVREINPLSVSIAMDGRITFANTWTSATQQAVKFFSWRIDNDNKLLLKADSTDAAGERLTATHEVNNVIDFATFNDFVYEGVLQSVNVALRVGSTFFQVAANGQAGGENATLTSLVDLSATDLDLVDDDYMGTIGTFRVWDKDLGDDGIVEATNPSLEPSLSLTFEGTGTNSFIVNDWSQ